MNLISTRRQPMRLLAIALLVAGGSIGAAEPVIGLSSSSPVVMPAATAPTRVTIGTGTSPALGRYLTSPNGRTLYTLSSDPTNRSRCIGRCAEAWPPLLIAANGKVVPPSGVTGSFVIVARSDGTHQVSFDGHPLYGFVGDTAPGQTNGEGIVAFGGTWHVAKAS